MTKVNRNFLIHHGWSDFELDTSQWKSVDIKMLSTLDQDVFKNRQHAINLYLKTNMSVTDISVTTRVKKQDLYRFIEKCLITDIRGEIIGYRALIPYKRTATTVRQDSISDILIQFPEIREKINSIILGKNTVPEYPKEHKIPFTVVHRYFLKLCAAQNISIDNAPFNLKDKGLRNFQRYAAAYLENHFTASTARQSINGKKLAYMTRKVADPRKQPIAPLERVEFDGHKIDAFFTVGYTMPSGEVTHKEISRIWILIVIDVVTRCVLGYYITFNPEYNADDVIKTLKNSLQTWKPKDISIDGLEYGSNDGFPNSLIPETINARWLELYLDNGMANRAKRVQEFVVEKLHANFCLGPVGNPIRRPFVERFFHRLEDEVFHRLPSTTGSNPNDIKRQNPVKNALKFDIKVTEIEQLIDVWIAKYNNSPHRGIENRTPLQVFQEHIDSGTLLPQYSQEEWEDLKMTEYFRQIVGSKKSGVRPYVNFENVQYTSDFLRQSPQLIGQKVLLKVDSDDIRKVKAYLVEDGTEIGFLIAKGKWGLEPHDLRLRKAIWQANNDLFDVKKLDNPVDAFLRATEKKSKVNRTARARVQNRLKITSELASDLTTSDSKDDQKHLESGNIALKAASVKADLSGLPGSFITKRG